MIFVHICIDLLGVSDNGGAKLEKEAFFHRMEWGSLFSDPTLGGLMVKTGDFRVFTNSVN